MDPPPQGLRRDRLRMYAKKTKSTADEPAVAKAMAGKLQIYADNTSSQRIAKATKIEP